MIDTLFATDALNTPRAFLLAFFIGLFFGVFLEQAGFGSSRKLAGVFYFRDMAVIKVMFSAVVTAMIGLSYFLAMGWIETDAVYLLPTIFGAQLVGGLIFGIGFVISGWCPGTAAAGLASGKMDALVALVGAMLGSVLFSEVYPAIKELAATGDRGVLFVYDSLTIGKPLFVLLFTAAAVVCFVFCEVLERKRKTTGLPTFNPAFLKAFSVALLVLAAGLFVLPAATGPAEGRFAPNEAVQAPSDFEESLLAGVEEAADHVEPEVLAEWMMLGEPGLVVVDVRSVEEFNRFHLRGAVNVPIAELNDYLSPYRNTGVIVLYSNGMTHPAQARDSLFRLAYRNVFILTDGLAGFMERCLKPVSLRSEPLTGEAASRVAAWRAFFYSEDPDSH